MNYHDAFGVPGRRHAHVQQLRAAPEPALRDRHDHHAGARAREIELGKLEPLRDFCFCTDGVRGHLTVAAHGVPGDVYVYGQGENISMARLGRPDPPRRRGARLLARRPRRSSRRERASGPGASDVMALRVGYEKLNRETGWKPKVSWEEGVAAHDRWYAENRDALDRPRRLARRPATPTPPT